MKLLTAGFVSLEILLLASIGSLAQGPIEPPTFPSARSEAPAALPLQIDPKEERLFEFQADEIGLVIRTLARIARINAVISDRVISRAGTVTMRIDGKTPKEAIEIIVQAKGLVMDEVGGVVFIMTPEEHARQPASKLLSIMTERSVPPLAHLKGEYYRKLIESGVPEATASTIVINEKLSDDAFSSQQMIPTDAPRPATPFPPSEWVAGTVVASAVGLEALGRLPVLLLHLVLAIAIWMDARRLHRAGLGLVYFNPLIWAIATLIGGVFLAAFFWVAHHSTLRRPNNEV